MARGKHLEQFTAGAVFGFKTKRLFGWHAEDTGRYGALKVLGDTGHVLVVSPLDVVTTSMPTFEEVKDLPAMRRQRFGTPDRSATLGCGYPSKADAAALTFLGEAPLSADDEQQLGGRFSFGYLDTLLIDVEAEWRWQTDPDAYAADSEEHQRQQDEARAAAEHRYETRLKDLSLTQLMEEDAFERWSPSPPFPPKAFIQQLREQRLTLLHSLDALGPKPKKAAVRKVLKAFVSDLNNADAAAGGVIETEEREDIFITLDEMCIVVNHPSLIDEVNDWRTW